MQRIELPTSSRLLDTDFTFGVATAAFQGNWFAALFPPMAAVLSSMPAVVTALLAFYLFGLKLQWFPMSYAAAPSLAPGWTAEYLGSVAHHAVLPLLVIVLVSLAQWVMTMRNAMINVLGEDIITMAEAQGLSQTRIMLRHASRNAVLPVVTSVAMCLGFARRQPVLHRDRLQLPGRWQHPAQGDQRPRLPPGAGPVAVARCLRADR